MSLLSIFRRNGSSAARTTSSDAGPRAVIETLENRRLLHAFWLDPGGYGTGYTPPVQYDTGFYHAGPTPRGIGDGGGGGGGFGGPFQPAHTFTLPPGFEPSYPPDVLGPMLSQLANPPDSRIATVNDVIQYMADSAYFGAAVVINAFPGTGEFLDPAELAQSTIEIANDMRPMITAELGPWLPLPHWDHRQIQWVLDQWWRLDGFGDFDSGDFGDFGGFGGFGGGFGGFDPGGGFGGFGGGGFGGGGPGDGPGPGGGGGPLPRGNPVTVFRGAFGGRYG